MSDENPHDSVPHRPRPSGFVLELFKVLLIALVVVLPIRILIAEPFIVSGSSMVPTFENANYLIINKLAYRFGEPSRFDVIVFHLPDNPSKFLIKRVIGLPTETVRITHNDVQIINEEHPEGMNLEEPYLSRDFSYANQEILLGEDEYFVMGDNRLASSDSRIWGPLDDSYIVGSVFLRVLPITELDVFPGSYTPNVVELPNNT